jgi:arsenate reductase
MAEAILRHTGGNNVEVFSAGSMPTEVHPNTLWVLSELGIDTSNLYAKSLDQFLGEAFDYIITVCDRVRDICPVFRGDPFQIHWSFPDPDVIEEPELQLVAFRRTAAELQTRVRYLLLLPHPRTGERLPPPIH